MNTTHLSQRLPSRCPHCTQLGAHTTLCPTVASKKETRLQRMGESVFLLPIWLSAILIFALVCLWIDSYFHLRRLILFGSGDVGLGFRSASGSLDWIEWAPWEPAGLIDYVRWSIPFWVILLCFACFLCPLLYFAIHDSNQNA